MTTATKSASVPSMTTATKSAEEAAAFFHNGVEEATNWVALDLDPMMLLRGVSRSPVCSTANGLPFGYANAALAYCRGVASVIIGEGC